MLYSVLILHLTLLFRGVKLIDRYDNDPFADGMIAKLKNDANLDLPADSEYEDLRAELLAYHTALATITSDLGIDKAEREKAGIELGRRAVEASRRGVEASRRGVAANRRSMGSPTCWDVGGICVNYKLCSGFRFLTEVPGCMGKLNVCCFTGNQRRPRDQRESKVNLAHPLIGNGKIIVAKEYKNDEEDSLSEETEQSSQESDEDSQSFDNKKPKFHDANGTPKITIILKKNQHLF